MSTWEDGREEARRAGKTLPEGEHAGAETGPCTCYPGGPHEGCDEFDGGPRIDMACPSHGWDALYPDLVVRSEECACGTVDEEGMEMDDDGCPRHWKCHREAVRDAADREQTDGSFRRGH